MSPSLAYISSSDGRLVESYTFDGPRRRLLSIRHLAANADGLVCLALQDEGPRSDPVPLVAFHGPGEAGLDLRAAPHRTLRRMKGYTGAAALDSSGAYLAVSAPRGGLVTIWDVGRRELLTSLYLADGCGVAPTGRPGCFLVSSRCRGSGAIRCGDGSNGGRGEPVPDAPQMGQSPHTGSRIAQEIHGLERLVCECELFALINVQL